MTKGVRFAPETITAIEALAAEGKSSRQIGVQLGISFTAAGRVAAAYRAMLGMEAPKPIGRRKPLTSAELAQVEQLARDGLGSAAIAKRIGRCRDQVQPALAEMRVRLGIVAPSSPIGAQRIHQVERLVVLGETRTVIAEELGIGPTTVDRHAERLRARVAVQIPKPLRRGSMPPATIRAIEQAVASGGTLDSIAAEFGISPSGVHGIAKRWRERGGGVLRPRMKVVPTAEIVALSKAGTSVVEIAKRLGVGINRVQAVRREHAHEACRCGAALNHRGRCLPAASASAAPDAEKLLAVIRRHVPRTLDPVLRDDIVSELYLAVLQGEVGEAEIAKAAPAFISRAFATWADKFRSRSMDAPLGDTFEDATTAGMLDEVEIGAG